MTSVRTGYKVLLVFICTFLATILFTTNISALEITSRSEMGYDETLVRQDDNYIQADSIVITPIYTQTDEYISDYDWIKGLFYYQTVRLNQGDFLFHYLVSKSGQAFKGAVKGDENRFRFTETNLKPIVIAYLASEEDTEFDSVSRSGLAELLLEIMNKNAISPENIYVKSIEYIAKPNEAVLARLGSLGGRWERTLNEIVNGIKSNYKPESRQYLLKVENIGLPANPVSYGDNVVMNVTITNNSDFILLKGNIAEPIMTLNGGISSRFFLNGVWSSLTQTTIFSDGEFLRPHETKTFNVRLKVPLYFELVKENFYLTNTLGEKYADSNFDVSLTVNRYDKKVIEITKTETGQLNVREHPWYNAGIVNRVTVGSRFVVLEETPDGWLRLDLPDNKTGWIVIRYTKTV